MIDLRSDTVTQPTAAMREAMLHAVTGDDVYGEDPTVNALESLAASMTGKEAAVFASSGTQTNLLGILSHCERGHEYIVGSTAHTYMYEGGGAAVLGSVQPCTIPFNDRGELPLDEVAGVLKPDDSHFAISRLVCLENTQAGKVLSLDYLRRYSEFALSKGLLRHLDGARAFNAAAALNVPISDICQYFDSVSLCLSKGLGCPVGSVLVGDAATIKKARRWRKMLGGGMRQAGILAAAGIHALEHHVGRLHEDHDKAAQLAGALDSMPGLKLAAAPQTNIVMLHPDVDAGMLKEFLLQRGIRISGHRWVFHQDISTADMQELLAACTDYSASIA
ncbi:MAG: low-specificity L-threonine aldolase [Halioglobus sp.]